MENQFVPYELALKLKELGFDEMCIATFDEDNNFELQDFQQSYDTFPEHIIAAPLWQQAFDWFREKGLYVSFNPYQNYSFDYKIFNVNNEYYPTLEVVRKEFKTYEEAREACLLKLIEVVETDKPYYNETNTINTRNS